ncbi:hypothetical protein C8R46DRAFT_1057365 [Mycena filopes]|nr:hypothetical protein C8R46DRAFT_1057365 [Mycena filopes]
MSTILVLSLFEATPQITPLPPTLYLGPHLIVRLLLFHLRGRTSFRIACRRSTHVPCAAGEVSGLPGRRGRALQRGELGRVEMGAFLNRCVSFCLMRPFIAPHIFRMPCTPLRLDYGFSRLGVPRNAVADHVELVLNFYTSTDSTLRSKIHQAFFA